MHTHMDNTHTHNGKGKTKALKYWIKGDNKMVVARGDGEEGIGIIRSKCTNQ